MVALQNDRSTIVHGTAVEQPPQQRLQKLTQAYLDTVTT